VLRLAESVHLLVVAVSSSCSVPNMTSPLRPQKHVTIHVGKCTVAPPRAVGAATHRPRGGLCPGVHAQRPAARHSPGREACKHTAKPAEGGQGERREPCCINMAGGRVGKGPPKKTVFIVVRHLWCTGGVFGSRAALSTSLKSGDPVPPTYVMRSNKAHHCALPQVTHRMQQRS